MDPSDTGLRRRDLLHLIGSVGGASAVCDTMVALGMIQLPDASAAVRIPSGQGRSVVILGAGIGGLTAAYELKQANYQCTILEGQNRVGGRSLTARRGTKIVEVDEQGQRTTQVCRFDEDLYANLGPSRIPYHHRRVLHYCSELGVPLEPYVISTTANRFQDQESFGGSAITRRQIHADTQGYLSELLAKAIRGDCLDEEIENSDQEKLLDLLRVFGDLDRDTFSYEGSTRAGCRFPITVYQPCEPSPPLSLRSLLSSSFWNQMFYQSHDGPWQPNLFQIKGGMDNLPRQFAARLQDEIRLQHEVKRIVVEDDGVVVHYRDRSARRDGEIRADYCLCNIPLPILQRIPANFSQEFRDAVHAGRFDPSCKVAWQANQRFWERGADPSFGGISYINHVITQMWYPSHDFFSERGTIIGAYNYAGRARRLGRLPHRQRLVVARQGAQRLHQEFGDTQIVPDEKGVSIAWQNIPYQEGGWPSWRDEDTQHYRRLLAPDRRFHLVGDQVSMLPAWQEGAMMSAVHVVEQIAGVRPLDPPQIDRVPDTRRMVQGLI